MPTPPQERETPIYHRPSYLALVFVGGAVGTGLRMLAAAHLPHLLFPSTLPINLLGAFALGLLTEFVVRRGPAWGGRASALLGTGVCGGFTTYSTFALESFRMAVYPPVLAVYLVLTLFLGLAASYLGVRASKALA